LRNRFAAAARLRLRNQLERTTRRGYLPGYASVPTAGQSVWQVLFYSAPRHAAGPWRFGPPPIQIASSVLRRRRPPRSRTACRPSRRRRRARRGDIRSPMTLEHRGLQSVDAAIVDPGVRRLRGCPQLLTRGHACWAASGLSPPRRSGVVPVPPTQVSDHLSDAALRPTAVTGRNGGGCAGPVSRSRIRWPLRRYAGIHVRGPRLVHHRGDLR